MKKTQNVLVYITALLLFAGCADMNIPKPQDIVTNPIGSNTAKVGMSKSEVLTIYGEPDFKSTVMSDKWEGQRAEWFYKATMGILPVNAGHLAEDMYLYFDEGSLTNISKRPLGRSQKN